MTVALVGAGPCGLDGGAVGADVSVAAGANVACGVAVGTGVFTTDCSGSMREPPHADSSSSPHSAVAMRER
jgi:hypothetical protein